MGGGECVACVCLWSICCIVCVPWEMAGCGVGVVANRVQGDGECVMSGVVGWDTRGLRGGKRGRAMPR